LKVDRPRSPKGSSRLLAAREPGEEQQVDRKRAIRCAPHMHIAARSAPIIG
jgi:hypothetical protein